jgi:hypothetical protein
MEQFELMHMLTGDENAYGFLESEMMKLIDKENKKSAIAALRGIMPDIEVGWDYEMNRAQLAVAIEDKIKEIKSDTN